ncbi:MAG TPA: RNA-directed DNA polymerase, partial [Candidatus Megamonas gallistercoris]|nr:RNA-directed DNA polymerase [Candidatus Megamonas gallistercoris]
AKQQKNHNSWYDEIDTATRNINNQETKGLLIGPHVSNLLSEIILVAIDKELYDKNYKYIRHIDDFTCYVSSYEEGQQFIIDLKNELDKFNLLLNFKKVDIKPLPISFEENWLRKLKAYTLIILPEKQVINFNQVSSFLDFSIELMKQYDNNSAILNYAIKILSSRKLSSNAIYYYTQYIFHLTLIYPYIIPLLDEYIFTPFKLDNNRIANISREIYSSNLKNNNFEGVYYAIFFALKYNFNFNINIYDDSIASNSCLFKITSFLYAKKYNDESNIKKLRNHAKNLYSDNETFEQNWLFVYEALSLNDLKDIWKSMKKNNISFIKKEFHYE